MANDKHFRKGKWAGVYYKYKRHVYRRTCEKGGCGYKRNRWDAHHILPGVTMSSITDDYWLKCLRITDYNINADYSMGGLPKLTAYILYFQQRKLKVPYKKKLELTVTMRRWKTVRKYAKDRKWPIDYPDSLPVHNPCNWGHVEYEEDAFLKLKNKVFDPLQEQTPHPPPKNVKQEMLDAKDALWADLVDIGKGLGGGEHEGVEDNFRNRYTTARDGWWKPMCMSKRVDQPPSSPILR